MLLISFSSKVCAVERLGMIGQSWSFPMYLSPNHNYKGITQHLDMSYFLHENWAAFLSINTQVNGPKIFSLELGPDLYPIQDVILLPFLSPRFIYTMIPNGKTGWYVSTGFEVHIGRSSQIENMRLRVSTGMGQMYVLPEEQTFVDLVRLGLIWCF